MNLVWHSMFLNNSSFNMLSSIFYHAPLIVECENGVGNGEKKFKFDNG